MAPGQDGRWQVVLTSGGFHLSTWSACWSNPPDSSLQLVSYVGSLTSSHRSVVRPGSSTAEGVQPTVAMGVDSSTLAQAASKGHLVKARGVGGVAVLGGEHPAALGFPVVPGTDFNHWTKPRGT